MIDEKDEAELNEKMLAIWREFPHRELPPLPYYPENGISPTARLVPYEAGRAIEPDPEQLSKMLSLAFGKVETSETEHGLYIHSWRLEEVSMLPYPADYHPIFDRPKSKSEIALERIMFFLLLGFFLYICAHLFQ